MCLCTNYKMKDETVGYLEYGTRTLDGLSIIFLSPNCMLLTTPKQPTTTNSDQ